MLSGETLIPW